MSAHHGQPVEFHAASEGAAGPLAGAAGSAEARIQERLQRLARRRRRPVWVPTLNLTPMIDIVFNLLFFFLIASRFGTVEGMLPARLPTQAGVSVSDVPRTPIRIRLIPDAAAPEGCRVTIERFNESPIAAEELAAALRKIRTEVPGFDEGTPVHLLGGDVTWDHVVNAYNAAMAAGYEKIFFAGAP